MSKEFVKAEKKNIERKSGLYKIVKRDTQETYIGMSSSDMRSQIYSRLAPSAIARDKDRYRLSEAVSTYKEDSFDFYVMYLDDTKENLQKVLNVLIDSEKPSLNAYSHHMADEPCLPPPKPQLTITAEQTEILKASIAGVKDFFIKNTPDYSEVYQLLIFMLMHPDQDVESHIQNIGNEFLTPKGETKTFKNGVVFLATGTMIV